MRVNGQWLVKSSGRILGPFPTDRIAELLRSREISVLDEVSEPLRRWQTIQYHANFKDTVEALRRQSLNEKTEATWTPNGLTGVTQTLTDMVDSDLTEEVTMDLKSFNTAKEIVIHNIQEHSQISSVGSGAGRYQPQQVQMAAIRKQVEKTTRGLWILTVTVLVAALVYMVQKRYGGTSTEGRMPAVNLKQSIISLVQIGHYGEALRELKSHHPDPMTSGELAIYYGSLLIQVEGQTVMGRRLLNSVLSAKRSDVKLAYTGLGVADLIDGQIDSAEANFDKALAIDPDYVPAILNLGGAALKKGDYRRAKTLATRTLSVSPFQGEAILLMAEAQFYLAKSSNDMNSLTPVARAIRDFQSRQWDYFPEVGLYGLYFDFLRRERNLDERILKYLDQDPRLTQDHRHNVFIHKGRASWAVLGRFCEQMVERMAESLHAATLLASCYSHEGRWDAARKEIEKAVHRAPKDPLVQAWYSHILKESGDADQASVIFARATEFNRKGIFLLPTILQARFSQENEDVDNARTSWQRVYERDMNNLSALAGLAWVQFKNRSYGEASKFIEKGLRVSPDYIPLLELRQIGEADGWYGRR